MPKERHLGSKIIQRRLLKECVSAGEKEDGPSAPLHRLQKYFPLVDTDPNRPNEPIAPEFLKRAVAALAERVHDVESTHFRV
jgi:hypothetical protein